MANESTSELQVLVSSTRLALLHKWVHQSTFVKSTKYLNQKVVTSLCSFSNEPFNSKLVFEVIRFTGTKCDGYKSVTMLTQLLALLI